MRYILILTLAFTWIQMVCLPFGDTLRFPRLFYSERAAYAIWHGKIALPVISLMNDDPTITPETRVYGLWLEDHRYYARFRLIGSIYGYGSHLEVPRDPAELWEYLNGYECEYVVWDDGRLQGTGPYFERWAYRVPIGHVDWGLYFEQCPEYESEGLDRVHVWRVRESQ